MIDLLLCIRLYTHIESEREIQTYFCLLTDRYTQCIQLYLGVCVLLIWITTAKAYLNITLRLRD